MHLVRVAQRLAVTYQNDALRPVALPAGPQAMLAVPAVDCCERTERDGGAGAAPRSCTPRRRRVCGEAEREGSDEHRALRSRNKLYTRRLVGCDSSGSATPSRRPVPHTAPYPLLLLRYSTQLIGRSFVSAISARSSKSKRLGTQSANVLSFVIGLDVSRWADVRIPVLQRDRQTAPATTNQIHLKVDPPARGTGVRHHKWRLHVSV